MVGDCRKAWVAAYVEPSAMTAAALAERVAAMPKVRTADGRLARERGGFVTQSMINQHGSADAARDAMKERQNG
jgi:hypothetical protein